MRRKNTKSTCIYWLVDTRTGTPFYCGKTVYPTERLNGHLRDAKFYPDRPVAKYLNDCGEHIRLDVMETVAPDGDWCAAEKRWIEVLRNRFPMHATNVTNGGSGVPGYIFTDADRRKISAGNKGKTRSAETRAKISAGNIGKPKSAEHRVNMRNRPLHWQGKKHSDATIQKMKTTPRNHTAEGRARMSAANKKPKSPEHRAALSLARKRYLAEKAALNA